MFSGAAAWWSMASQLAAQDYLARLHAVSSGRTPSTSASTFPAGFPGISAADNLIANYTSAMSAAHSKSSITFRFGCLFYSPSLLLVCVRACVSCRESTVYSILCYCQELLLATRDAIDRLFLFYFIFSLSLSLSLSYSNK